MIKVSTVKSFDDLLISYEVSGNSEPALVFAHCWCGNRNYFKNQVEYFSKKYRVIIIDLAGHGESGKGRTDYTIDAFGKDVASVVKRLNPAKVILIGHSMGGPVMAAASVILQKKVIGLIGIDTFANVEFKLSDDEFESFIEPYRKDFKSTTKEYVRTMFPPEADKYLVEKTAGELSSADEQMALSSFKELYQYDLPRVFSKTNYPVRLINSNRHSTNTDNAKKYIKNFDLKIMENTGHFMMMEDPERFNRILDDTIDELLLETQKDKNDSSIINKIKSIFR